jgi:hypothetical protein
MGHTPLRARYIGIHRADGDAQPTPRRRPMARRTGRRIAALGAAATLVAGLLVGVVASTPASAANTAAAKPAAAGPVEGPAGDAFYLPPSPLPAGKPGDIIRYRKITTSAFYGIISVAFSDAYKVMYLSQDTNGKPIAVVGTILVPLFKDPKKLPIVGYAPGTNGVADICAPSKQIESGTLYDLLYINGLINRGFAVAVTDYEGLGTPGDHTYVIGRSEGHAVNDVVRAASRLPQSGLVASAPVVFTGYSQGGGGAAWAGELQPTYAPEINLKGIAAGGIPADLMAVAKLLDGGPGFAFLAAAAIGLNAAYPELKFDSYLTETGRTALKDAYTGCVLDILPKYLNHKISEYTTSNPIDQPDWQARINEQKLGLHPPKVPMYQWHSTDDEMVAFPQADQLHKTYCAAGVNLQWAPIGGEHITGFPLGTPSAEQWVADRFAGKPTAKNC